MSKESRRRQRAANPPGSAPNTGRPADPTSSATGAGASGAAGAGAAGAQGSTRRPAPRPGERAGRRERPRYQPKRSFLQRYRNAILTVAVLAGIALVGAFVFTSAAQPAFACSNLFEPAATASPAAGTSPQPGFVQPDMGRGHVATGAKVTYASCPPASGNHYNGSGVGPIPPRVYSVSDSLIPQNWVHNLEHGSLVLLYRGDSPAATPEGQTALRAFYDTYPPSPICGFPPGTREGPVFVRFDDMAWPMAALVWDRVLPLQDLDTAAIIQFDSIYGERTNPEKLCAPPSAVPSAVPSGSPAASASVAPSASAAPASVAPSAAPSAAPSEAPSTAPSEAASPSPS